MQGLNSQTRGGFNEKRMENEMEAALLKPRFMKKCKRGKGTKFTAILRRSQFSWPGKRRQQVTPLIAAETRWFKSPYVGVVSFNVRKQISLQTT